MIINPLTTWLASRARKRACTTVTMHATAGGSLSGALSTLRLVGLSYHYLIDKDGRVTKCVPASRVAYHAGKSQGPGGPGVNDYSIGISFVNRNDGKDPITEAQLRAARLLVLELKKQLPLKYLTTHYSVSWGRKTDPRLFDLKEFAGDVGLEPWKMPAATWRTW